MVPVLAVANLPLEGVGILLAVDTIPDMFRTTANLTGALLCRKAAALVEALEPGGYLILSGILASERDQVVAAFSELELTGEAVEDEWVGLSFNRSIHDTV